MVIASVDTQLTIALVTAVVSIATTLVVVYLGPRWTDRINARRAALQRSQQLFARYSEPFARAGFELQSRLYNICKQGFMTSSGLPAPYRSSSTLWLFGQFLAWMEILRREVQTTDSGDVRSTATLQRHLFDVVDILATGSIGSPAFHVLRGDQRAIGELMVVDRSAGDQRRSDSMGYAEFVRRMEAEPAFAQWFSGLDADVAGLMAGRPVGDRAIFVQRALIDLLDFLDPDRIRFPDPNERGKIALPTDSQDRKRLRPASEIARFRFDSDPFPVVETWAHEHRLRVERTGNIARVALPRRLLGTAHDLVVLSQHPWVELHVVVRGRTVEDHARHHGPGRLRYTRTAITHLNALLRSFDRPLLLTGQAFSARPRRQ